MIDRLCRIVLTVVVFGFLIAIVAGWLVFP